MKVIPLALAQHMAQAVTTLATCLKVVRTDSVVVGYTDHDEALSVNGQTYEPGFDLSSLAVNEGLATENMKLSILADDSQDLTDELLAGRWNNAFFEVFEVNYAALADSPGDDINILKRGTMGEVELHEGVFVVELRGLLQALQQTQGKVTSKTCRARLGDALCTKDLTAFTYSGTVSAVTNRQLFDDSTRREPDGWFAEGIVEWLTGDNEGLSQKVKAFEQVNSPAGEFTLSLPMPYDIQVGDTYSVIAGCRKRLEEDCRDKFDNVLNFQGEPHLPGQDKLTKTGLSEAQPAGAVPTLPDEVAGPGP